MITSEAFSQSYLIHWAFLVILKEVEETPRAGVRPETTVH